MKLLVVVDNKEITDVVRFYCDTKGLECTVVNNGNEGLDVIRKNNEFDLILLDLAMPEVSGLDVIKSIKKENLMEEIRNSAVKGILKKPCSVDDLNALIEKFRKYG